jgi:hypothetical protein
MNAWSSAYISTAGKAESVDDLRGFECTAEPVSPQGVFGSYWTDANGTLIRATRWPAVPRLVTEGVMFLVHPRITQLNAGDE